MQLIEQMVLLAVDSSRTAALSRNDILSVINLINRRHRLEVSPERVDHYLQEMTERGWLEPSRAQEGHLRLASYARDLAGQVRRSRPAFASKFVQDAGAVCPALRVN